MPSVYLSSTYEDLREQRAAVHRQLRRLDGFQVHAMEDYVARDDRPKDRCLADVEACDVYVGIFAWRSGFVPPGETASITELEYRAARKAGKKCLIFLLAEDAPWKLSFTDSHTGENGAGERVKSLRQELRESHSVGFFTTPDDLAAQVSAAVQTSPGTSSGSDPQFRELRSSLLLACAPADRALAEAYAELAQRWFARGVVVSVTALFTEGDAAFADLEATVTQCEAGLVVLSPASLGTLLARRDHVTAVLRVLEARLGQVRLLACGDLKGDLPEAWRVGAVIVAPETMPDRLGAPNPTIAALQQWAGEAVPAGVGRTVGLPFCVLAMNAAEAPELRGGLADLATGSGVEAQARGTPLAGALAAAGVDWETRYGASREAWRPFGHGGPTIAELVAAVVQQVNAQPPPKLRDRRIKVQWYPFDVLAAEYRRTASGQGDPTGLRQVYRDMARAGCVAIVDELSLCHPVLGDAFRSSPLMSGELVAMVTVSPVEPRPSALLEVLEQETRRKLAGAFDRYEMDLDPQCELAIPDARRLKRWLHANLPETVAHLRDPRPNSGKMDAFFKNQLGSSATRPTGGSYGWGGGGTR